MNTTLDMRWLDEDGKPADLNNVKLKRYFADLYESLQKRQTESKLDTTVIYYEGNTALSPIDNFTLADTQGNIVSFTQEATNDSNDEI